MAELDDRLRDAMTALMEPVEPDLAFVSLAARRQRRRVTRRLEIGALALAVLAAGGAGLYLSAGDRGPTRLAAGTPPAACGGRIATVAGGGLKPAQLADGGRAVDAALLEPVSVAVDRAGNLYIGESGLPRVRRVDPGGTISTVAGTGLDGFAGDGGLATRAFIGPPVGLAADAQGNVYIADKSNRVRKVSPNGRITTVAGSGDGTASGDGGPATRAGLTPNGIAVDGAGTLYIADTTNFRVRKVTPDGIITTAAGTGQNGFSGDGGPAKAAAIGETTAIAVDPGGTLYLGDRGNGRVRKVTPDGIITTVAGNGTRHATGDDGPARAAGFETIYGIAVDGSGNVYVSDMHVQRVRRIGADGVVVTAAGSGQSGLLGDGGPAKVAEVSNPVGLAVNSAGQLYVADFGNNRVRVVSPAC